MRIRTSASRYNKPRWKHRSPYHVLNAALLLFTLIGSPAIADSASSPNARFEVLPELQGLRITAASADGTVVAGDGIRMGVYSQAFRWDGKGPVQRLKPAPGQCDTTVSAISADGRAVLVETLHSSSDRVYRWLADGTLLAITPEDQPHGASAINDDGSAIAGYASTRGDLVDEPEKSTPFLWTAKDGYKLLPLPVGTRSAEPTYFSTDGRTLYGAGRTSSADTGVRAGRPVIVHWEDGALVQAPLIPLALGSDWRARLLPLAEVRELDLRYPDAYALEGDPMRIDWVSADGDVILGEGGWPSTRMIWTRANGPCRLTDWLDALGVDYPRSARLEGLLTSRDGRTLFGRYSDNSLLESVAWRIVAAQPLGRTRVSSAPYCGGNWP
ncbi:MULTISPECIES: hypothetical protein [Pseudomonas]|uniref:hypothetical protein n=1 Tax=Pseudomonas TaxID=286 RepID=UPI0023629324|nr:MULTISPECIES: hypothetical protein [Pseudomonas]WJV25596.1 hypothetical protein PSR66_06025 [Pseudomonas chlororaphis]